MRLELTGRHVEITPAVRRLVDAKVSKLERLLNNSAVSAQVVLTREKFRCRAEITLHARGEKFLHGVGNSASWAASLVEAMDKIGQQAQKVKGKWKARKRRGTRGAEPGGEVAVAVGPATKASRAEATRLRMPRILRTLRQAVKPMSVTDAAREVDASSDGLVVFRDLQTAVLSVLYRRQDGELALVETEV